MADHEEDFDSQERGTVSLTPEQRAQAEKEKALLLAGVKDTAERQAELLDARPKASRTDAKAGDDTWPDQRERSARPARPKPVRRRAAVPVADAEPGDFGPTLEEALADVATTKAAYAEAKRVLLELL